MGRLYDPLVVIWDEDPDLEPWHDPYNELSIHDLLLENIYIDLEKYLIEDRDPYPLPRGVWGPLNPLRYLKRGRTRIRSPTACFY